MSRLTTPPSVTFFTFGWSLRDSGSLGRVGEVLFGVWSVVTGQTERADRVLGFPQVSQSWVHGLGEVTDDECRV